AGMEEARLVYSGVAHTMPSEPGKRLVVDIGGGSTELIIGEGLTPLDMESLQMGCVALSERFFRDGKISAKRMERARLAARLELEPVEAAFRRRGWDACAGSSGTVRAIGDSIRALDPQALSITPAGINRAIEYSIDAGDTRELKLEPITEDRRPVFPGGLAQRVATRRAAGAPGARVGRATARDRARCLPQRLSPPRRVPPREGRYAGLPARGAAAAAVPRGSASAQGKPPGGRGARAALGSERPLPDRAAAPRGAAASRPQQHRAAADRAVGHSALARSALSCGVAR